jgi:hypothetical protein
MADMQNIEASVGENNGLSFKHSRQLFKLAYFQTDRPSWPGGVAAPKAQTGWWLRFER